MCERNFKKSVQIQLVSTWDVGNDRKLDDSLTLNVGSADDNDVGSMGDVSLETCVHLINQSDTSNPCELRITLPPIHRHMNIVQLSILSEARVIELYGCYGEYVNTMEATFIDEFEDIPVYKADAKLNHPSHECCLKFVRSKRKCDMWLYGINIYLQKSEAPNYPDTTINFQAVNKILKESGHQLTEKAERCKKFLQIYRSTSDSSKMKFSSKPDMQTVMKLFETKYLNKCNPLETDDKHFPVTKCITDELTPTISTTSTAPKVEMEEKNNEWVTSESLEEFKFKNELKHHVERCFHNLEVKLMSRVEEKLTELEKKQNEKFDFLLFEVDKLQRHLVSFTNKSRENFAGTLARNLKENT